MMGTDRLGVFHIDWPQLETALTAEDAAIIGEQLQRVVNWWGMARRRLYDEQTARNLTYVLTNASFDYCRYPREPQLVIGDPER